MEERRDLAVGEESRNTEELLAVNWVSKGESDRLRWSPPSFEERVYDEEVGVMGREMEVSDFARVRPPFPVFVFSTSLSKNKT